MWHRGTGFAFAACVVVALLSQGTHVTASGCGNVWLSKHEQTTWEGKLRVQQQSPEPAIQTGLNFLTYFTYTRITMTPDSDTFTQLIVGQDIEDTVTCEYTCHDDKLVSHGDIRFDVVSGKVMAGSDTPFSQCPENADDPNMQLVAKCQAGHAFSMIVKPYTKANNGSWHYEVQFLGAVQPQPTEYYITCTTPQGEQLGFATQGFFRPYTPPQITAGWYKRPGTWVISFFFVLFAGGWLYLFASVKWNEIPVIPPPGDSEDEESDDSGSEYDSGSDGSGASGSGSGSEYDSDDDAASSSAYSDSHASASRYTDSVGGSHSVGGSSAYTAVDSRASVPPPPPAAVAGAGTFVAHCPNCGEGNPDPKATFCSKCGQPMR